MYSKKFFILNLNTCMPTVMWSMTYLHMRKEFVGFIPGILQYWFSVLYVSYVEEDAID